MCINLYCRRDVRPTSISARLMGLPTTYRGSGAIRSYVARRGPSPCFVGVVARRICSAGEKSTRRPARHPPGAQCKLPIAGLGPGSFRYPSL